MMETFSPKSINKITEAKELIGMAIVDMELDVRSIEQHQILMHLNHAVRFIERSLDSIKSIGRCME